FAFGLGVVSPPNRVPPEKEPTACKSFESRRSTTPASSARGPAGAWGARGWPTPGPGRTSPGRGGPGAARKETRRCSGSTDTPPRGAGHRYSPFGEFDASFGGWEIDGEPYTTAKGSEFMWWRSRMLGGRTNHWGRISLRFGPYDFKARSRDGLGDDWPIAYEDLAPYYDKLDRLVGLFGTKEGLPNEPDGVFLPPPAPRCH